MSNLLTPVDLESLETVTGGATTTSTSTTTTSSRTRSAGSSDQLLQTLTSLSQTIKDIGNAANKSGFSTTEILMLGLLLNQNRGSVNVFVRRPYW
jgi:hypothetical protein